MRILQAALFSGALFFGVLSCLWIGWQLGRARMRSDGDDSIAGLGAVEGHRRELIVDEVNAIGTAWLRLDLLEATARDPTPRTATVVLPPVNEMFDLANTRLLATRQHPPIAIYFMLGFLALVSALLAGFGMAKATRRSAIHVLGFAAVVSISVYLILDLEFPRLGLLRVDAFDQAFLELRRSMD